MRHEPNDLAGVAVRQHVERAVGSFADAADAAIEIRQQTLFADDPIVLEHEPDERFADERRDEQVALPRRKKFSAIERDASPRDIGRPEIHRLLHPLLSRLVAVDRLTAVLPPVADDRKAVVLSFRHRVDLVAAARSVFARPQHARAGMNRNTLNVSDADRENLGARAAATDERVVGRNRSVRVDAQHLAHVAVELLRLRPVDRVDADAVGSSRRDEQRAVARLNQTAAGAFCVEQHFEILEAPVVGREVRPRGNQHAGAARQCRWIRIVGQDGVGQVDRAV